MRALVAAVTGQGGQYLPEVLLACGHDAPALARAVYKARVDVLRGEVPDVRNQARSAEILGNVQQVWQSEQDATLCQDSMRARGTSASRRCAGSSCRALSVIGAATT